MKEPDPVRLRPGERALLVAGGVADGAGASGAPGAVLLERGESLRVILAGPAAEIVASDEAARARRVDLPGFVLIPALVNAHTHLDLTAVGPRPHDPESGFVPWIDMVRRSRTGDEAAIRESVREGIRLSARGGVAAVGDIAGDANATPIKALRDSPMMGVSFVEIFGMGGRQAAAIEAMERAVARRDDGGGVRLGVQPHAPYSAGPQVFTAAARLARDHGVPVSTHLAESVEERRLFHGCEGPMREFLEGLGLWSDEVAAHFAGRRSPVAHLARCYDAPGLLVAHANDLSDADIEALAALGAVVALCPRGHAYFGHARTLGAHRWRDLRRAGVRVCLATDSVINLPPGQCDRISPLDDARLVFREQGDDPATLLSMITTEPARALGLESSLFTLREGHIAGVLAIEVGEELARQASPADAVLRSGARPVFLAADDERFLDLARENRA